MRQRETEGGVRREADREPEDEDRPLRDIEVRVLLLFAHPAFERSRVNRALIEAAQSVEGITIHDLYEEYPDFHIEVRREQQLLMRHDIIVLQHPLLWYSTPAIIKEWEDLVLEHGWAYGSTGTALRGKRLVSVVTSGGREESYQPDGYNRFTLRQLLAPIEATARLCGMCYGPPYAVQGTHMMKERTIASHAQDYASFLAAICTGRFDWENSGGLSRLNPNPRDARRSEGEGGHAR